MLLHRIKKKILYFREIFSFLMKVGLQNEDLKTHLFNSGHSVYKLISWTSNVDKKQAIETSNFLPIYVYKVI